MKTRNGLKYAHAAVVAKIVTYIYVPHAKFLFLLLKVFSLCLAAIKQFIVQLDSPIFL